jgi:hypothetical protein
MKHKILLVDASINFILGILLITYPIKLIQLLGIPQAVTPFYSSVLGAVLCGIALALVIEYFRTPSGLGGLALGGAVAINICAAFIIVVLLVRHVLYIPWQGYIVLWILVVVLVIVSMVELIAQIQKKSAGVDQTDKN